MTVSVDGNRNDYNGDGVTTDFTFSYPTYSSSDLYVYVTDSSGVETLLVLGTDYTVAGAGGSSCTVSLVSASTCATGETLTILRILDRLQSTDWVDGEIFTASSMETRNDKTALVTQQLQEQLDRSLHFPRGTNKSGELPESTATTRAGKALGFDDSGDLTLLTSVGSSSVSSTPASGSIPLWDAVIKRVDTLAALRAFSGFSDKFPVFLAARVTPGDGGGGFFRWDSSDLSTEVTADVQSGLYVAPDSDSTGASGAWVRIHNNVFYPEWFGAKQSELETAKALSYMARVVPDGAVMQLTGTYDCGDSRPNLLVNASNVSIIGPATIELNVKYPITGYTWKIGDDDIISINNDDVYRSNYLIDGITITNTATPYATMGGCNGVYMHAGSDLVIRNCRFFELPQHSIVLRKAGSNEVDRVTIKDVYAEAAVGISATYSGQIMAIGAAINEAAPEAYYISDILLDNVHVVSSDAAAPGTVVTKTCMKIHNGRGVVLRNCSFDGYDEFAGTSGTAMITGSKNVKFDNVKFTRDGGSTDAYLYLAGLYDDGDLDFIGNRLTVSGRLYLQSTWGTPTDIALNDCTIGLLVGIGTTPYIVDGLISDGTTITTTSTFAYLNTIFRETTFGGSFITADGTVDLKLADCKINGTVQLVASTAITGYSNNIEITDSAVNGRLDLTAAYTVIRGCKIRRASYVNQVRVYGDYIKLVNNILQPADAVPDTSIIYIYAGSDYTKVLLNAVCQDDPQTNVVVFYTDAGTSSLIQDNSLDINVGP